jgi:hypothetical protein
MRKRIVGLCAVALAIWLALGGGNSNTEALGPSANSTSPNSATASAPVATPSFAGPQGAASAAAGTSGGSDAEGAVSRRPVSSQIGFRTRAKLDEHFAKHGREFGRLTIEDYVAMAQRLRDAPPGGDVLEIVRKTDGVISRYDRSSGAFLAVDPDGTIRTFFKPNDGEAYFRRQATRSPSP